MRLRLQLLTAALWHEQLLIYTGVYLSKLLGGQTNILGAKGGKSDKCMGVHVSQLLRGTCPGCPQSLRLCWCPSPFPPSPSISRCFFIHSSSPAIGFHSCFFFTTDVSAPIRSTLHLLMVNFQAWD